MKLKHIAYRTKQLVFRVFLQLAPLPEPKRVVGVDSLYQIINLLQQEQKKRILLVTTPGFIRRGTQNELIGQLKKAGISVEIYSEVMPDPTTECVEKAAKLYQQKKSEAFVAIGGGSVMDCTKIAAARVARPKKSIISMSGSLKIRAKLPMIIAVPTTAGTGSEVTAAAVITDGKTHYKHPIMDYCIVPDYAVLDPNLTLSLPASITAATGMDALTHAVEAYTNLWASKKVRIASKKAVKLICENLLEAYKDGNNQEARKNMLIASYEAGIAFTNNYVGYVHALAHAIGGIYGVPHGKANAIILPVVLDQFKEKAWESLSELTDVVGLPGKTQQEKAQNFIQWIREMNQEMELPDKIEELKVADYDQIIDRAIKEGNPGYPVPVIWEREDFESVLTKLTK